MTRRATAIIAGLALITVGLLATIRGEVGADSSMWLAAAIALVGMLGLLNVLSRPEPTDESVG